MLLIADASNSDSKTAILVVLVGALSSAITWVANYISSCRTERRKQSKEDEQTTVDRYKELMQRIDQDRKECREDYDRLTERLDRTERELTQQKIVTERAVTWIRHHESLMDQAKLPYPKWSDTLMSGQPGTGLHNPLPPDDPTTE